MRPPARYEAGRLSRETTLWFGGAFLLNAVASAALVPVSGHGAASVLITLAASALFGVVAVPRVREYHPYPRFGHANGVTLVRMCLTCLLAGTVAELDMARQHTGRAALAVVAVAFGAICLDGVDGRLARRGRMMSRFGARFDMEVDSLLLLVLAILGWRWGKAGIWILAIGGARYLFLAAGWVWPLLQAELPPSIRRKAVCALQGIALCLILLPWVGRPAAAWIAAIALGALGASFAVDLVYLIAGHRGERDRDA